MPTVALPTPPQTSPSAPGMLLFRHAGPEAHAHLTPEQEAAIAKQCPGLLIGLTVEVRPVLNCSPVLDEVRARRRRLLSA